MWTEIFNFIRVMKFIIPLIIFIIILLAIHNNKNENKSEIAQKSEKYIKKSDVVRLIQDNIEEAYERNQVGLDISFLLDKLEELETIERY